MQVGKRRTTTTTGTRNNGVISGSVWDSRMRSDEVKGGVKVFNGEENSSVGNGNAGNGGNGGSGSGGGGSGKRSIQVFKRLRRNQSSGVIEKRKTIDKGIEGSPIQLRKSRSDSQRVSSIEKNQPIQIKNTSRSDSLNCKDLGVCKEKTISISSSNVDQIKTQKLIRGFDEDDDDNDDDDDDDGIDTDEEEEEMDEEETEIELQKKSYDVKEIDITEHKPKIDENEEKKSLIPISSNVIKQSTTQVVNHPVIDQDLTKSPPKKSIAEQKPRKQIVIEEKKLNQINRTSTIPISSRVIRKPPQVINHPVINQDFRKSPTISEDFERFPETQNKLQNLVDLIMWRDVSKSALVFGFGTFVLLSSSFTKDLNFSLISSISYMGLLYLAAIFLYRSIICRGAIDLDDSKKRIVVGEQEAIWLLKLILPYLNEFLLKLRSLFSGDPATTMKLGVLLFILAHCGSSITIWKVVKIGFFGVFTVPKVCSSYSTQLTEYGKFWVRRFRDAWESCTHKKAVAGAVFTLIWNLSSIVARIWAVFMLIVAIRYYQQSCLIVNEDWDVDIDIDNNTTSNEEEGQQNTQRVVLVHN